MKLKKFTKQNPCTKVELYNCFFGEGSTQGDIARSSDITRVKAYIGRNAPVRLQQAGHAEMALVDDEPHLLLTQEGQDWLLRGTQRYLRNHPERIKEIETLPRHWRRKLKTVAK